MLSTISGIFAWLRHSAIKWIVITAILFAAHIAQQEVDQFKALVTKSEALGSEISKIDEELNHLRNGTDPLRKAAEFALTKQLIKEQERDNYQNTYPILSKIPLSDNFAELQSLNLQAFVLAKQTVSAAAAISKRNGVLVQLRDDKLKAKILLEERTKWLAPLKEIFPYFWIAAGILALGIISRIGIKCLMYFFVVPAVTVRSPLCLIPLSSGSSQPTKSASKYGKISAVSLAIDIDCGQELLVRPDYLQVTSDRLGKSTKWLLNASMPYSSLLSGMFLLTRLQAASSDEVRLTNSNDPISELAIIDLEMVGPFICQARSLIGVVQDSGQPIRITRHWRLCNLQSWLTLQLRYLVFHGPGKIIVKGCRGVNLDRGDSGRIVSQSVTIGFSAHLSYSTSRCETFMAYLSGKRRLFNDRFSGENGVFAYEGMQDHKHASGLTGRGLEGIFDVVLKVGGL